MSEEGVEVAEKAVDELRQSFAQGEIVDDEGRRFLTEELVGSFKGLTVRIFGGASTRRRTSEWSVRGKARILLSRPVSG